MSETVEDLKAIAAALADRASDLARARWVRRLRRRPSRFALTVFAFGVACFVTVNAGWLQTATHPAPLFGAAAHDKGPIVTRVRSMTPTDEVELAGPRERVQLSRLADQSSQLVASIQERLAVLGHFDGVADGLMNAATADAIRAFERQTGLPETGEPGVALLSSLAAAQPTRQPRASRPETVIRTSAEGGSTIAAADASTAVGPGEVRNVQAALSQLGYGPIAVDGIFGAETAAAIRRFEAATGRPATGAITRQLLDDLSRRRPADT